MKQWQASKVTGCTGGAEKNPVGAENRAGGKAGTWSEGRDGRRNVVGNGQRWGG